MLTKYPCVASSRGGEIEYHFEVAVRSGQRFTRFDFEVIRDTIALYLKVLEEGAESNDVWEGEPH